MKAKLVVLVIVSLGLVGLLRAPARAQSSTSGAVQGVVTDKDSGKPIEGVTIVVRSPALQGSQSTVSDGSGSYKVTNLPPGTYQIDFYYATVQQKRTGVVLNINKTTPVFVKLDTSRPGEVIEIDGTRVIDITSPKLVTTLDDDFLKSMPIPCRDFTCALGAAPGTSNDGIGVSFSGSSSLESSYIVDGVSTTGLAYGNAGSSVLNDFIEEIEIITGGYNAEYGRSTGAVVNVVTKSGSDQLHGGVFSYVQPGFLVAQRDRTPTQSSSIDAETNLAYSMDFGFDLGGPILKDKIWFYVGFAPQLAKTDITRITKRRRDCQMVLAGGELSECNPNTPANGGYRDDEFDEDPETGFFIYEDLSRRSMSSSSKEYQLVSKLNFAVDPRHQGQISLIGSPYSSKSSGVVGQPSAVDYESSSLTTDLAAKWTSKFDDNKTEVEAVLGWHRSTSSYGSQYGPANTDYRQNLYFGNLGTWSMIEDPRTGAFYEDDSTRDGCLDGGDDSYPGIDNCPDEGVGYRVGGPGFLGDDKEERLSAKISATRRVNLAGNHEIKAGLDIEDNHFDNLRSISGGAYFDLLQDRSRTEVLRWVQLTNEVSPDPRFDNICGDRDRDQMFTCDYLAQTGPGTLVQGNTTNWSAYLRDSWQLMPNLTINAGLRYEEQRMRYAKELQNTYDSLTDRDLGKNAMVLQGMFAPRLGFSYDWTRDGRSKVYGNWGRFYESIPLDINDRSFGGETLYKQVFDSSSQCGDTAEPGFGGPSGPDCISDEGQACTTDDDCNSDNCGANGFCVAASPVDETLYGTGVLVAPGIKAQYLDEYLFGTEYEILEDTRIGLSFQNRRLGRVLEDVSTDGAETYIIANPGEWSADEESELQSQIDEAMSACGPDDQAACDLQARLESDLEQFRGIRVFDKPKRDYNALQLTAVRRFSRNLFLQASYTYSRTKGNFPGLYSADNGQVDPNISSQYDLIELLANRNGPLPQDRPHYFKVDTYYTLDLEKAGTITGGARVRALSGVPIDALAKHHTYGIGESFLLPRGAMGRTEFEYGLDLHIGYARDLARGMRLEGFCDLFNVLNRQGVASVDEDYTYLDSVNPIVGGEYADLVFAKRQTEEGGETSEPVRRNPNFRNASGRYAPLSARVGLRLTF
jgi:hypothetical protein